MYWRGGPVYKKRQIGKILSTTAIVLGVLFFMLVVDGLIFCGMKYVFHLDFSQEYRQVEEIAQLRFWKSRDEKVYIRYPFGLRPIEKREDVPEEEKPALSWLYTSVCDVADSGGLAAWYDWKEDAVFIGNGKGEIQKTFDVDYDVEKLVFSPEGRYLLVYEAVYAGGIRDDEERYYRVSETEAGE